jgi:pimeloyl-ACP methyl ester carboxylesterase
MKPVGAVRCVVPNAQLLIYPDAGHGAQFQYPDRFLKHAIQFLEE